MNEPTTFKHLGIGDRFVFSRYHQTGLLDHLGKPGTVVHEKTSARKWRVVGETESYRIGSIKAQVWEMP